MTIISLEVTLTESRLHEQVAPMQFTEYFFGKYFEVTGNIYIVEMNQTSNQICIRGTDIIIHPAPDNISQVISV